MSLSIITLVSDDDLPRLHVQVTDDATGYAMDLSDARYVATARFRLRGSATTLFEATMTKANGGADGVLVWDWPDTGLDDLTPGRYEGEVSIDFNGEVQTIVEKIPFKVIKRFEAP